MKQQEILQKIVEERNAQDARWGKQNHEFPLWATILGEEVGEVNKAILDFEFSSDQLTPEEELQNLEAELIQVAAVAVAIVENIEKLLVNED